MLNFNELKITSDGNTLIIDISVKPLPVYENIFLNSIYIDTQDTFKAEGQSDIPVYIQAFQKRLKSIRLELTKEVLNTSLDDNIFFIWVLFNGSDKKELGVTVSFYPLYKKAFTYIKELEKECSIPKRFINYILQLKAFQISIKSGNFKQAILYWKKFFNVKNKIKGCNHEKFG